MSNPRYAISVAFDVDSTELVWLTSHPDTETPDGAIVISDVVRDISGTSQKIDPDKGQATIGGFSFAVVDKNSDVTEYIQAKLIAGKGLRQKLITVYKGEQGDTWAQYFPIVSPIIDGISNNGTAHNFRCSDIKRVLRRDINDPDMTTLSRAVTANQGHIPVSLADLTLFKTILHDANYPDRPSARVQYARIQDEIFAHEGVYTHAVDGTSLKVFADYIGTHTGANNAAVLTGSGFVANAFIGLQAQNVTDGSTATITANTATTITGVLSGGAENDWDAGDSYRVITGRGALNTRAAEHSYETGKAADRQLKITEHIYLAGSALKLAHQIMTGHVAENLCVYSEQLNNAAYSLNALTVLADNTTAPDGTLTAERLTSTGAADCYIRQAAINATSALGNRSFTFSFWIKGGVFTSRVLRVYVQDTSGGDIRSKLFYLTSEWHRIAFTVKFLAGEADTTLIARVDFGDDIVVPAAEYFWSWGWQVTATTNEVPYYKTVAAAKSLEVLPDNWHLGVAHSYVRFSDYLRYPDVWNMFTDAGKKLSFEGVKKTDGKKLIETEINFWLSGFMPIYPDGQIGFQRLSNVLSDAAYEIILNADNIVSHSDITNDYKSVINDFSVDWNHVYGKDEYSNSLRLIDLESIGINQEGNSRNIKLRGVYSAANTDQDVRNHFDGMRDSYSGAPLLLSVECLPSLAYLNVGTVIRLEIDSLRDFTATVGTTTIRRAFMITQVSINYKTGRPTFSLFGSSRKAGTLKRTTLTAVLADAFYSSEGVALNTVLTMVGNVVTASGPLGTGIYYHLGDLTINAGVTVTITGNVQLRVRGHRTLNGTINGKGGGGAGGVGATLWSNGSTTITGGPYPHTHNGGVGVKGGVGTTAPTRENKVYTRLFGSYISSPIVSGESAVPYYNLINNNTSISGLPADLRGCGGSGGDAVTTGSITIGVGSTATSVIRVAGTVGAAGGAGLLEINRGASFGVSGSINLSGNDAPVNTNAPWNNLKGLSGAGGASGGYLLLLDGNYTPPTLVTELISLHGDSPYPDRNNVQGQTISSSGNTVAVIPGIQGYDMTQSGYRVQYIPTYAPPVELTPPIPPDVTGFTVINNGLYALLNWQEIADNSMKYKIKSGTVWATGVLIAVVSASNYKYLLPTIATYDFMIKAVNLTGEESVNVTSNSLVAAPSVSVDSNLIGADDYLAATFFYHNRFETLDGLSYVGALSIETGNGLLVLSATSGNAVLATKYISSNNPLLSLSKKWKIKTDFTINSGTGQYGSTTVGAIFGRVGISANQFGCVVKWNAGTSKLDIFGITVRLGVTTLLLITSINDTGIKVDIECVLTPSVDMAITVTIGSVKYSGTITTNLPTVDTKTVMEIGSTGTNAIAVVSKVSDFISSQE